MSKLFALLAVLLIASGALVLAVPRDSAYHGPAMAKKTEAPGSRSLAPEANVPEDAAPAQGGEKKIRTLQDLIATARDVAEKVNAPLSIIFGLVSLLYSRRTYLVNKERAERASAA